MRTITSGVPGLLLLVLAGCQSVRVIDRPTAAEISRLDRGEVVGVVLMDGTSHALTVTGNSATHLAGTEQGRAVVLPIAAIEEVRCLKRASTAPARKDLEQALAAIAASLALATGEQDTVNPTDE